MQSSASSATTVDSQQAQPKETGCCPRFDPTPWQDRECVWRDKLFLQERVHSLFHVPLDMKQAVERVQRRAAAAQAAAVPGLMLGEEVSPWRSNLLLEVTKEIPSADVVRLSGTYYTRVFDGPFRDAPKWMHAMEEQVKARGQRVQRMFLGYTTCPKCAEAYGHNYVVLYAQVA